MPNEEEHICCICHKAFTGWGNNPDGAVWKDTDGNIVEPEFGPDDICCDECDSNYVLPGRLYKMAKLRGE